ncbi:hypothetical protein SLS53_000422 [Cytospora paraplurivora]|uniref:Uncharacterized protein n=1 Tax=Cytospora paraplurivora TaxID=2898453 RepID=A0AAN9YMS2_9PEZI
MIDPMTTPTTNQFPNIGLLENPSAPSMFQFIPSQMVETVPPSQPPTGPISPIAPLPTPASLNLKSYNATADAEVDTSAEFHEHQTTPKTPSRSTSVSNGQGCSCLQRVVLLIDEFESQMLAGSGESLSCLDSALASHKEAVRYGESMLACQLCSSRVENMTILSFLTERLAVLCERIVAAYMEQVASAPVVTTGKGKDAVVPARHDLAHETLFLGEYEVDLPSEWNVLLGHLIAVQLAALNSLVGSTKASSHTRWRSVNTEKKIKDLLERLRQFIVPYSR